MLLLLLLLLLLQAVVQTPVGQTYPPATHTSHKSVDSDKFKEELAKESLKLKTSYAECPTYDLLIPALLEDGIAGQLLNLLNHLQFAKSRS